VKSDNPCEQATSPLKYININIYIINIREGMREGGEREERGSIWLFLKGEIRINGEG